MCTAIMKGDLFGRTFDLDRSYGERVVISPRGFGASFLRDITGESAMAIMGIGCVREGKPLYYDGMNEKGLCMAALNFPESARYLPPESGKLNVASFELIPRVLGFCGTLDGALELIEKMNITPDSFSSELPPTPLHWMLSQMGRAAVVEATEEGIKIYEDSIGVLTNEPPLPYQHAFLSNFASLSPLPPKSLWLPQLRPYGNGTGAVGLPGDYSPSSRFVRAAFLLATVAECQKEEEVSRFFHITDSISIPEGCVINENGRPMTTRYTVCYDTAAREICYTTAENRRIRRLTAEMLSMPSLTEIGIYGKEDALSIDPSVR